ncbi:MAG: TOBE domain-containing protein, partial [Chloroflexota bacterium]
RIEVGVRPEYLELTTEPGENTLAARVTGILDQGSVRVIALEVAGHPAKVSVARGRKLPAGDVLVRLPPEKIRVFVDGELAEVRP